ncbi:uncharacterized protein LOC143289342 [Babylonia areolata]|uniref:uncharacterized protein LOC143289342 n=1 Tax=Babylonia areolata TaxID=304850 RepID=UPI003FD4E3F2
METKVSAGSSRRSQQQQEIVPAAVEAVLLVGSYPKDLVLSTYHHLTTASPTRVDRPGTEGASAGAPEPVTAQALMTAMLEQAKASHSHSSPSGASWLTDEVERREGGADDEVEEDGAGDEPGRPSSSGRPLPPGTTPGHREATADSNHSVAVTTEAGTDPSSSSTTTAGPSTGAAATGQHTVPTGAEAPTETSSTCTATSASGNDATSASGNDATSASGNDATSAPTPAVSGQPVVPLVFSTPENESAPPQQPHESQWPADTSFTFSTPPEGSSLAEECHAL